MNEYDKRYEMKINLSIIIDIESINDQSPIDLMNTHKKQKKKKYEIKIESYMQFDYM